MKTYKVLMNIRDYNTGKIDSIVYGFDRDSADSIPFESLVTDWKEASKEVLGWETFEQVELRKLKLGDRFMRKPNGKMTLERNHYNPKDSFGPATFSCSDENLPWGGHEVFLKPSTIVYRESV